MRIILVALIWALATPVLAQDAEPPAEKPMPAALSGVPETLAKRLRRAPDDFVADAASLILGYGRDQGIDRAGIAQYVAVERARARAGALRRMWEADLNADGAVTQAELGVLVAAAEARYRGRMMLTHEAADGDGDGTVTAVEMLAKANVMALEQFSVADEERAMAMLTLDLNGDGTLSLDEVREVARMMGDT
jgi:EF hand